METTIAPLPPEEIDRLEASWTGTGAHYEPLILSLIATIRAKDHAVSPPQRMDLPDPTITTFRGVEGQRRSWWARLRHGGTPRWVGH